MKPALFILVFFCFKVPSLAQSGPEKIGNFTLLNAVDEQQVSLQDFSSKKALVLIFTSNYCPYSKLYEDRIINTAAEFSGKNVQFLLVNSINPASNKEDAVSEMKKKAVEKKFTFPYLADKDQRLCKSLGATKTPEVFVYKNTQGGFYLQYKGALDDNPQVPSDVAVNYLADAIRSVVEGTPLSTDEKKATGCLIKLN